MVMISIYASVVVGNRNVFGIKIFLLGNENSGFENFCNANKLHHLIQS